MPIRILPKTDKHDEYSRKQRQKQYMDKHGEPGPRRKRLNPDLTAQKRAGKIKDMHERLGGGEKGKPHSSREGRVASGKRRLERYRKKAEDVMSGKPTWPKRKPAQPLAKGGRIGLKKGSNKNWIQKAVNPKHKGFCTPMTKKTCTPRRKALARTFKKMGRARKGK